MLNVHAADIIPVESEDPSHGARRRTTVTCVCLYMIWWH